MRLVVPYLQEVDPADIRLMQIARLCGVPCVTTALSTASGNLATALGAAIPDDQSCVVLNGSVLRRWVSAEQCPADLASYLTSRFPFLLIHNLDEGPFAASTLRAFSGHQLTDLRAVAQSSRTYQVAAGYPTICGVFSGLEFGPVSPPHDRVFVGDLSRRDDLQPLVTIDGQPLFARMLRHRAQVFFLAGRQLADLGAETGDFRSLDHFSRLVPPVMFLRHAFADACWRPNARHATLVIDDPLLQERYGFLNYSRLLELMDRHGFHTSIAFIPRNRLRTSERIARLFRDRPDRYSLCVHGNDHTAAEFGTPDTAVLNSMLQAAVQRMEVHRDLTSVPYDRVMVFPQGVFSEVALRLLQANNFTAAVNSHPNPHRGLTRLRLVEYVQPAITGYGGAPLFLRKYVHELSTFDAAFSLFFGQPVLIVEHHAIFKDPDRVTQLVSRINSLVPDIQWSSLQTTIESAFLTRGPSDNVEVLTYAGRARVANPTLHASRCSIVKPVHGDLPIRDVLLNDTPLTEWVATDGRLRASFDVQPGTRPVCSLTYRNDHGLSAPPRYWRSLRVTLRRRASELRDNYLSKSPRLLSMAERMYGRFCRPAPKTSSTT
jgi:peptidoglycan/xylan/chitin deacetylase (PgdA/CDA1 family)